MKNVLILSSSHTALPAFGSSLRSGDMRKGGNTDLLCDEFAKGAIKGTKYLAQAYKLGLKVK